ncbi:hypothetical protein [Persicobacter sp. CCB-QB2]|uniref:hypothetical protein n=1 Tax=Persicobacter sp. CCB-QB2 TaxID=1561025 RepID=UPI0006A9C5FD|nr:hypothetical protein [Persicobacter sp. CCB-QB2]
MKHLCILLLFIPGLLIAQSEIPENDSIPATIIMVKYKPSKQLPDRPHHALRFDLFKAVARQPAYQLSYENSFGKRSALQTDLFFGRHQQDPSNQEYQYDLVNSYGLKLFYKRYHKSRHRNYRYYLGAGLFTKHYTFHKSGEVKIAPYTEFLSGELKHFKQRYLSYGISLNNGYLFRLSKRLELGIDWSIELHQLHLYDNEAENYQFIQGRNYNQMPDDYRSLTEPVWVAFGISLGYLW